MRNEAQPSDDIFPMRLTSMEKFHLHDSNPTFINHIYGRLAFRGKLDVDLAAQCVQHIMARHPMFTAVLDESPQGLIWRRSSERFERFEWNHLSESEALDPELHRIRSGRDWNIWSQERGSLTEIWFRTSHTVCDGLGAIQGVTDLIRLYHQAKEHNNFDAKLPRLELESLTCRGRLGLTRKSYLRHLWKQPLGLFGATKFIFRKPCELVASPNNLPPWQDGLQPRFHGAWLDHDLSEQLKQQAAKLEVAVNTLFCGQLMKTLESFRIRNKHRSSHWIRILLPMNIRGYADRRLPATNATTVVQVDRRESDFALDQFHQSLDREISIIRDWELGKLFLIAVRGMSAVPGLLKRAANNGKCRGTAVFANLAQPFRNLKLPIEKNDDGEEELRAGNLRLVEFDLFGPIRHRTPVNFSVQKHLGRYRISLHSDPRLLTDDQAQGLLSDYIQSLEASVSA